MRISYATAENRRILEEIVLGLDVAPTFFYDDVERPVLGTGTDLVLGIAMASEPDCPIGGLLLEDDFLSFFLARPYWSRGIMTEAVGGFCQSIQGAGIGMLLSWVRRDNAASRCVLAQNGFQIGDIVPADGSRAGALIYARSLA